MATEYDEDFTPLTGSDLRSGRQARGIGQGELERLLGLRKSTLRYHESRTTHPLPSPYRELASRLATEGDALHDLPSWFEEQVRLDAARKARRIDVLDLETDIELSETGAAFRTQTRLILRARDPDIRGVPIGRQPIDKHETHALVAYDGGTPGRQRLDRRTQELYLRFERSLRKGEAHVVTYAFSPPADEWRYALWSTDLWRINRYTLLLWVPPSLRETLCARQLAPRSGGTRETHRRAPTLRPSANGLILLGPFRPTVGEQIGVRWWIE